MIFNGTCFYKFVIIIHNVLLLNADTKMTAHSKYESGIFNKRNRNYSFNRSFSLTKKLFKEMYCGIN